MQGDHKDAKGQETPISGSAGRVSAEHIPSKKLGQILVEDGVISNAALQEALADQLKTGGFIGQILVDKGAAKQSDILLSLVKQCKIPHLSLTDYEISKEVLKLVPKDVCLRCNLIPIDKLGRILTVAMVNPLDDEALEEVRAVCPELRIKPILCDWKHFETVAVRLFNEQRRDSQSAPEPPAAHAPAPAPAKPAPKSEPAPSPMPAANDAAVQAAMNEAITRVIMSAATEGEPDKPAAHAGPSSTTESIQETILGAMQEALATVTVQMKAQSAPQPAPDEMMESLKQGVAGAIQDAVAPLMQQLAAAAQGQKAAPADLDETMREAVREVLRDNEAIAVARANRQDLEMRDQERNKRLRHASVSPFADKRRAAIESLHDPQSRDEADQRVLSALNSDRLLEGYTFEGFCVGSANAFTHKICRAVAEKPGTDYNPLFIYGDVGLGKTHLINATGNAILDANPDARVGYVSSSRFATRLTEALQERAVNLFRENYCHWEVLILDDIQFLGGRVEAQEEFFHIFNVLQQEGRQIIIAGDKPPDRLGMLEQRLISRFAGGIVVNLKPPEWETRVSILRHHAQQAARAVDDDILSLIAMRVPSDIRKMLGALRKILAFAELEGSSMSVELAGDILNHLGFNEAA